MGGPEDSGTDLSGLQEPACHSYPASDGVPILKNHHPSPLHCHLWTKTHIGNTQDPVSKRISVYTKLF